MLPIVGAALVYDGERAGAAVLAAHEAAWDARWTASDVLIEGDDKSQRAVRFAVYHLTSTANPEDDRVSIGAGAWTGGLLSRPRLLGYRNLPAALLHRSLARGRAGAADGARGGPSYGGRVGLPAGMSFAEAVAPLREGGRQARCMVAQRPATEKAPPGSGASWVHHACSTGLADLHPNAEFGQNLSRAPGNSSVILASDVLAGVIGHERGCDKAEHRANRNVCGDRK